MFLSNWKNKEGDIIKLEGKEVPMLIFSRETNKETTSLSFSIKSISEWKYFISFDIFNNSGLTIDW